MPFAAWRAVLLRSWRETSADNIGLVAAGVAFYGFLALVPLLGAMVLSYGLVAEPKTVIHDMTALMAVMPADAAKLVGEQLMNVVRTSGTKKGLGLLLALALALFGARNGAGSIMIALNIAYEERETRSFVRVNLVALGITAGGVLAALLAVVAIAALGHLEDLLPRTGWPILVAGKLLSYGLLLLGGAAGAATLYRYAPSRAKPRWVWLTPGSLLTALLWLLLTLGFGIYVANFGNYNATYGSLGAVVVLLTWLYLSSYVLLFGGELNAEVEHRSGRIARRAVGAAGRDARAAQPAPNDTPPAAPIISPSPAGEWAAASATSRLAGHAGLRRVGVLASGAATLGLALLRRRGRAREGAALIGAAALAAWLGRDREPAADVRDGGRAPRPAQPAAARSITADTTAIRSTPR